MKYNQKYLVDGKYSFKDLVDIDRLRVILERFSQATGFTTGLVSYPDQELLIGTGWRDICKNFHRAVHDSEVHCKQSNLELTAGLKEPKMVNIHHCKNGLVGGATPIVIKGAHVTNLFAGQVLFSDPDVERFRKQGEAYGYDVDSYLEALEKVPVVTEEAFEKALGFLSEMAVMLAEQGLNTLRSREAIQASKESERRFKELAELIPQPIWETDLEANFTYSNRTALELFGYTQKDLEKGVKIVDLMAPQDRKRILENFSKKQKGEQFEDHEYMGLKKDGTRFPILIYSSPIVRKGKLTGVRGITLDITERKRAEETLRESEERFRVLANLLPQTVFETDERGNLTFANHVAFDYFCYTQEDFDKGLNALQMLIPEDRDRAKENIARLMKGEELGAVEYTALRKNSSTFPIIIHSNPIIHEKKPVGLRGIIIDITERKQAEEALRQKSEEQKALLSTIPAFVYFKGWNDNYIAANKAFADMTGTSVNEIAGKTDYDFFPKEEADFYRKCDQEVMESGEPKNNIEEPVTGADGKKMWVSTSKTPFLDSDGKVIGMVGITVDITGRKRAEEALRESETNFRTFFNTIDNFLFILDEQGRIQEVNQTVIDRMGYAPDELRNQPVLFVHPEDRWDELEQIIADMLQKKRKSCPIPLITKKGELIPVETYVSLSTWNSKPAIFGVSKDISALKQSEEKFAKAFHCNPAIAGLSDLETGEYVEVNQTFYDKLGFTPEEVIGKRASKVVRMDMQFRDRTIAKLKKYNYVKNEETVIYTKNRTPLNVLISAEIIVIGDKKYNYTTAVDITEKKKAEEELRKLQKIKSVGTLAGGIAHDFNNILMGLFGNISIAKEELSKDHPGFKFLEESENSMNRATRLTQQLLTFAKGGEPVKEDVSIGTLVNETVRFDLSGSNVMPVFEQADDLWLAEVDKGQIQQVFSNLTINANETMPDGGHLYITLENADISENVVPNLKQGKYIKVTVRDKGTGIDKRHLDRIFDPYFSTKQTGSGLGLATAYSIINKHGGYIGVDSKPGKGTTFTLYLAASESQKLPETKQPAAKRSTMEQTTRILVMDDEKIVCEVITAMLENSGYSVETADGGKQAIEMYKQSMDAGQPFDVVIMDLTIPGGIGGKEAIKDILDIDPKASVIVSSGYADDPVMANYVEYGFKGVAPKPYTISKLQEVVNQVLKK